MGMRSVHFSKLPFEPPKASMESEAQSPAATPRPNALQSYASALRDAETLRDKLRGLVSSDSRHGDLQVSLSALRRIEEAVRALIAAEEES